MEAVTADKLKAALEKHEGNLRLKFFLSDIVIRGKTFGCKGFIQNEDNGIVVYVNTDSEFACFLFRYAQSTDDYRGLRWRFSRELHGMISEILAMLKSTHAYQIEKGCWLQW